MSVVRRGPAAAVERRAGRGGGRGGATAGGGALLVVLLLAGPAAAVEQPAPAPEGAEVDPCATTNPDGSPKEPDPMCQSGLPADVGTGAPAGDVLPRTGSDDRLLALTALGAGLVVAGTGAAVAGRRRAVRAEG